MAAFDFPHTPEGTLPDLWRAVLRLLPQLSRKVIKNVAIATVETPVAHGMGFAPQAGIPIPQADARVWQTRIPDTKCVYLAASAAVTCNVEIVR